MPSIEGHIDLQLRGKSGIVTGASSGIGAGTAIMLAAAGARVVLVGRDADHLNDTAKKIKEAHGECMVIRADITDEGAAEHIVKATVDTYGAIDFLIHSAGIYDESPITEATREELLAHLAVHVVAPLELSREAVPHMREGASMVLIGSNLVHYGYPGGAVYAAAKGAAEALARTLAVELGPQGIRVNVVSPGPVDTPMSAGISEDPEIEGAVISEIPLGLWGKASDIVNAIVFLTSNAASRYTSGGTLVIDGARFLGQRPPAQHPETSAA
ncbi:SDR family oxidoreductase [Streptomyces sp. NPDC004647]|uniref:SDR family NAD(P)-dependent oxidoreductase n=1 Tax=Streptomyces sp. NPDC004647 TaxID=3154671 RepID=UPI0033BF8C20